MDTRREFIKKAALLSGAAGLSGMLPESITKALAINPAVGSTYLDAEHVVILMQENRSFDHCYGSLQGVRGFNDPRAINLPNKNKVWLQTNEAGETYAPFRLNIKETNATWMGSLPHSWTNQVDARNGGKYDKWLIAKKSGHKEYQQMPLTLGYYNREDIPFYYALADAFTICDQNFCSSLTGTTPNRLYLWTGTIREQQNRNSYANVRNENVDYDEDKQARWKTFPERLEDNNISWKIYQNELSVGVGLSGEEDDWLGNFTDNPIEWFTQYNVKFLDAYIDFIPRKIELLSAEIRSMEEKLAASSGEEAAKLKTQLEETKISLKVTQEEKNVYSKANYEKLTSQEKNIHERAFTTNKKDPSYHKLTSLNYNDGTTTREMKVPEGDIFHQFREDVKTGNLPTVSWLVAPSCFSDHPGSPWYGAWYVSEAMDILTKDPEVWKKTIFILAYDENDGYFDHVPPFTPPHPDKPGSGQTSKSIDPSVEFVTLQEDMKKNTEKNARESSIGLGYRVPLVIASPWNRGGTVCSQVFDHTSVIQFLEKFLTSKTGKKIEETNISAWRRAICGDLTSTFKPYNGEKIPLPSFISRNEFVEGVHRAQFKDNPSGYKSLTREEIEQINAHPSKSPYLPRQEKGIRPACALPYELYANGKLDSGKKTITVDLRADNSVYGASSAGSPFIVYAAGQYRTPGSPEVELSRNWSYAVAAGDTLQDTWPITAFENNTYHLHIYGPNGFYRELKGSERDPLVEVTVEYEGKDKKKLTGNVLITMQNLSDVPLTLEISDNAYKGPGQSKLVGSKGNATVGLDLSKSFGWYDFSIKIKGAGAYERRYAGKVESGKAGFTDPAMGLI